MQYNKIHKQYWRINTIFTIFKWEERKQAYIECRIKRKVPKKRWWFEIKEFTFNWNSLHAGWYKKDFSVIPDYNNPYSHPFIEIFKDFWIEPIEYYKQFYL
jgi:hypothetical protein